MPSQIFPLPSFAGKYLKFRLSPTALPSLHSFRSCAISPQATIHKSTQAADCRSSDDKTHIWKSARIYFVRLICAADPAAYKLPHKPFFLEAIPTSSFATITNSFHSVAKLTTQAQRSSSFSLAVSLLHCSNQDNKCHVAQVRRSSILHSLTHSFLRLSRVGQSSPTSVPLVVQSARRSTAHVLRDLASSLQRIITLNLLSPPPRSPKISSSFLLVNAI